GRPRVRVRQPARDRGLARRPAGRRGGAAGVTGMETILESRSKTVVIGHERPFCIIGERINPTGRKAFQAQLQAGDLSQLEVDVAEQVAGGADALDVNVGDPLADEVALMAEAVRIVQELTELPLCIDSS